MDSSLICTIYYPLIKRCLQPWGFARQPDCLGFTVDRITVLGKDYTTEISAEEPLIWLKCLRRLVLAKTGKPPNSTGTPMSHTLNTCTNKAWHLCKRIPGLESKRAGYWPLTAGLNTRRCSGFRLSIKNSTFIGEATELVPFALKPTTQYSSSSAVN